MSNIKDVHCKPRLVINWRTATMLRDINFFCCCWAHVHAIHAASHIDHDKRVAWFLLQHANHNITMSLAPVNETSLEFCCCFSRPRSKICYFLLIRQKLERNTLEPLSLNHQKGEERLQVMPKPFGMIWRKCCLLKCNLLDPMII